LRKRFRPDETLSIPSRTREQRAVIENYLGIDCEVHRLDFTLGDHWDAESVGMVSFEKGSKVVMSLGSADPALIKRGEQNFARFASVLDGCLAGKTWLLGDRLTIADFAVGGVIPNAQAIDLSFAEYPEISRWYAGLCALPGWHTKLST
jgi:hypothetical protein